MSWAKLDDRFFEHPKVLRAGGDSALLYIAALCYTNANLTDGLIPAGIVARLTDRKQPARLADKLVDVGLWEREGGDYAIHDYHDENMSAEQVKQKRERLREQKRAAGKLGGKRSGVERAKQKASNGETEGKHSASFSASRSQAEGQAKSKPDADADADADVKNKPLRNGVAREGFDFGPLYDRYPRKIGKAKGLAIAQREVRTVDDLAALGRAIDAYTDEVQGRDKDKIAHFSTFMGRWRDYADEALVDTKPAQTWTPEEIAAAEERTRLHAQRELDRLERLAGGAS